MMTDDMTERVFASESSLSDLRHPKSCVPGATLIMSPCGFSGGMSGGKGGLSVPTASLSS